MPHDLHGRYFRHPQRVNIQFLTDPHGELIWASPTLHAQRQT
jgi:hypothetical protein